jgi:steroid delta-isomerase-like uncharacterized protein
MTGAVMTDNEQLIRDSVAAFNSSDWDTVRALASDDYRYEETGTGRAYEGVEDAIAALVAWKAAFPDGAGTVERVVSAGDLAVAEVRWRGTHTGPLATPDGEVPATGRPIDLWGSMWAVWVDGRMTHQRNHLDVLTMMVQLGLVPAPSQH